MTSTLTKKHNFDIVFDSQKVFRLILEAMSNPLKKVNINKYANNFSNMSENHSQFLAIAATLLDNEVSFYAENRALSEEIALFTLSKAAKQEEIQNADFIFVEEESEACELKNAVENAKCGTLADPHKSAVLIVAVSNSNSCCEKYQGPGIDGIVEAQVPQSVKTALDLRDSQCYEYPQGVDFIFVSENGDLFAIPRLVGEVR